MGSTQSPQISRTVLVDRTMMPQEGHTHRRLLLFLVVAAGGVRPPLAALGPPVMRTPPGSFRLSRIS